MEILKVGVLPEHRDIKGVCRNCFTEIMFKQYEAEKVIDQRDGDYHRIECPVCKQDITVDIRRRSLLEE